MMDPPDGELKRREEKKREAHWDPAARWRAIQDMIAWAEKQATVRRNTPERCLEPSFGIQRRLTNDGSTHR